jgi:Kdo2-lipid IVA lauroyltransferase/acyltransferase
MRRKRKRSVAGQLLYDFRYRFGEYALRAVVHVLPRLPLPIMLMYMRFMARLTYVLLWRYRRRMEENVASVFRDATVKERKALVWAAWLNFARGVLDTTLATYYSKEQICAMVALEGEGHIQRALEQGRGVLALSAHLGSFTMIGARLAAGGFPFSVVVKSPQDEGLARLIDGYRTRIGIHTISAKPRREAVRDILKALRDNRIVLMIADEFKSGDVTVDFLGLTAPAPRGPATLALRTGAITLPMFVTRRADESLVLSVGAPIAPVERDDREQSVIATTAAYTRAIEAEIRRYPGQWNWLGLARRDAGRMSRAEMARALKAAGGLPRRGGRRSNQVGSGTSL